MVAVQKELRDSARHGFQLNQLITLERNILRQKTSVTVIGAGIIGTSCAYALSKEKDVDVNLVDGTLPGGGTSSTGMAWLNASNKRPRDYFDLNFAGMNFWHDIKAIHDVDWVHLTGSIASEMYTPQLAERMEELQAWGYEVEEVRGRDLVQKFDLPIAPPAADQLFAHYPLEGWIDVSGALNFMLTEAAKGDFQYSFGTPVSNLEKTASGFRITLSDGTQLQSDVVVNAAGPRADRIAMMLGRELPLSPTKGYTLQLDAPGVSLDKVILSEHVDIRPDVASTLRIHNDTIDGMIAQGAATDRAELRSALLARATELIPELQNAKIVSEYMGVRPIPADAFSSVGFVDGLPGYIEAVTHSGVTMGPLVGHLVADMVLDNPGTELLTPRFSPNRFLQGAF
jgi:glycine/D-amino acid oxidase-like deaminating enzyme